MFSAAMIWEHMREICPNLFRVVPYLRASPLKKKLWEWGGKFFFNQLINLHYPLKNIFPHPPRRPVVFFSGTALDLIENVSLNIRACWVICLLSGTCDCSAHFSGFFVHSQAWRWIIFQCPLLRTKLNVLSQTEVHGRYSIGKYNCSIH